MPRKLKPHQLPCPKCGSTDINRELFAKGERKFCPIGDYGKESWLTGTKWVKSAKYGSGEEYARECIEHHCRGCQYEWCTEPLKAGA